MFGRRCWAVCERYRQRGTDSATPSAVPHERQDYDTVLSTMGATGRADDTPDLGANPFQRGHVAITQGLFNPIVHPLCRGLQSGSHAFQLNNPGSLMPSSAAIPGTFSRRSSFQRCRRRRDMLKKRALRHR
jgi:hypothetical protein